MTPKRLLHGQEAQAAVLRGVEQLTRAVGATLGPAGRNVVLQRAHASPLVTKDGATVAREIALEDPFEDLGAQLVREAATRTAELAGDGTTTAAVLAEAMSRDGFRAVAAGANATEVKRGIDLAVAKVTEALRGLSVPVKGGAEVEQVATIAANSDPEIGRMIAQAVERVGRFGVITVEEGRSAATTLEVVEGLQFDRGFLSPYFANDAKRGACVLEDPAVLVTDRKVSTMRDILPALQDLVGGAARALLVVADDVDGEALAALVVNTANGRIRACAVKAPGFGDRRKEMLRDIAVVTGATLVSEEAGLSLVGVRPEHLGRAKRAVVTRDATTLVEGGGSKAARAARAAEVEQRLREVEARPGGAPEHDIARLRERLAKLTGGVAVIHAGASTEAEMKERKARIEDALHATRAALEEGVVPGGGVALLRCAPALQSLEATLADAPGPGAPQGRAADRRLGVRAVASALDEPLRRIASNAGADGAAVLAEARRLGGARGYDALGGRFVDMLEAGIVDPTKVTRVALQNAASIAGLLLTTEALVVDAPIPPMMEEVDDA